MNDQQTDAPTTTLETTTTTPTEVVAAASAPAAAASTAPAGAHLSRQAMWYILAFVVVAIIGMGLWFLLERDGRVNTTVFSGVTSFMKQQQTAAVVNGTKITMLDFESTLRQLTANTAGQGVDTTDETMMADLRTQAIESLINTELLRQAALAGNISVDDADVESRYQQITQSIGGAEALMARMEELGVSEEMLRRDIRNDILIQAHIDAAVDVDSATVTDEEVADFYNQVAAGNPEAVPPLDEVRTQIEENLLFQKQQEIVGAYVDELRAKATVEIKV